jgi:hypothetical protein
MGLPSHCFFKGFKIPFWKKPTTADHYKDPNPVAPPSKALLTSVLEAVLFATVTSAFEIAVPNIKIEAGANWISIVTVPSI